MLKKNGILGAFILFVIAACGNGQNNLPVVNSTACSSGSVKAAATDKLTVPPDKTETWKSPYDDPFPGGSIALTPLIFTVTDSSGNPRNKVCLTFLTDGFWYTDSSYTNPLVGANPGNQISVETNESGVATMYWASEILPAANPVSFGTSTVAGADQSDQSYIKVYSGPLSGLFNYNWTVQGQQPPPK